MVRVGGDIIEWLMHGLERDFVYFVWFLEIKVRTGSNMQSNIRTSKINNDHLYYEGFFAEIAGGNSSNIARMLVDM